MMDNTVEQFRDVIRSAGLVPPDTIEADGRLRRFASNGKRGDDAGWYLLHDGGIPAGAFGDWRSGVNESWRADVGRKLTPAEEAAHRAKVEAMRREREAEEARRHAEAATKAAAIWRSSSPAPEDHLYLARKGIKAHGLRVHKDALVIPMRDESGALHSLQFIGPDGDKTFLTGGRVAGCYFGIGKPDGVLCVAEGFATAASIHEATDYAVAVAFNAANLLPVAESLRAKFPDLRLILCADDDYRTRGNPGLAKATEAARSVGGLVAVPDFGADRPEGATDFNDLSQHRGAEAVKQAISKAEIPAPQPTVGSAAAGHCEGRIVLRRVDGIEARPVRWLWPGRIARGKASMLAGHPGLGKSQVCASLAAIVTTGGRWPVDRTECERGDVVIFSAEDDPEDTIRPRLEAAGADLTRCHILDAVELPAPDGTMQRRGFSLVDDLPRLSAALAALPDVALMVIDPITAYLGRTDENKNAEVRAMMAALGALAAKHGIAILAVSHRPKNENKEALMQVIGSVGFVAAARAAYVVAKDHDDPQRRLMLPTKNNIGNDQTGCAFRVEGVRLESGIDTCRVTWESEAVTVTADEALAPARDSEERSAVEDAEDFLRDLLADEPVLATQVRKDTEGAGHSWAAIRRAQKRLGVESYRDGMRSPWYWRLPPKMLKNAEDAQEKNVSTFGRIEHLRDGKPSDGADAEIL